MQKVIAIVGSTATGKSALAVELALSLKPHAHIISADSRQVYKGLDIGSGKITEAEMKGVPHFLIDVADPKDEINVYSVGNFTHDAKEVIEKITGGGTVPIVCGGTGFYIDSLLDGKIYPQVPKNNELRQKLELESAEKLYTILEERDPSRAQNIDPHNKVRIIRALEIIEQLKTVPPVVSSPKYDVLYIGINFSDEILKDRIKKRLKDRFDAGMIDEAKHLLVSGVSYERMESLGLEYRYIARYVKDTPQLRADFDALCERLNFEIWHFAKRQKVWFKKNKNIHWLDGESTTLLADAQLLVKNFLLDN